MDWCNFFYFELLYYLFSNTYYFELLKAISLDSKVFSKRNVVIFQICTAMLVVSSSGGIVFRYTVYNDYWSNNWASNWSKAAALTLICSAMLGFGGAIYVYRVFSRFTNKENNRGIGKKSKFLLVVFGCFQLLIFGFYIWAGSLMLNPTTIEYAIPLGGLGNGIGIIK
jgi:hypothetical protein